jgi:hypothetical protein
VLREKSPAACHGISPCEQFVSLVKAVSLRTNASPP